jgi:hypothetical protein
LTRTTIGREAKNGRDEAIVVVRPQRAEHARVRSSSVLDPARAVA